MTHPEIKLILAILIIVSLISCKKDKESDNSSYLTSKTWGKPEILHKPENPGVWTGTTCGEYNNFMENGEFIWRDECTSNAVRGSWSWNITDKELYVDYQGSIPAINNKRIKIIELSDTLLYTIEIHANETGTSGDYWELKYRTRNNSEK